MDLDFYVPVRACKKRVTGKQPLGMYFQGRNMSDNWGRGVYSCICVMPDGFLLKSTQIQKEIRRAEHEYMNKHPPPPPQSAF